MGDRMTITPMVPTDDEIDAVVQTCRQRGLREFDVFRAVLWTFQQPTPFPTAQAVESVERDAARYRWLRDTSNADDHSHMIALHIRDEQNDASLSGIDAAIDAAMGANG